MSIDKNYSPNEVSIAIADFCVNNNKKFVYISGNGGSGKTELARSIAASVSDTGHVNVISMDDFLVDSKLRSSAVLKWDDPLEGSKEGRYTSSAKESYFIQSLNAIILNLKQGNDYIHWPRKAKSSGEAQLFYGGAVLTIVEGVGTVYLDRSNESAFSVFLECENDVEKQRRIERGQYSNEMSQEAVSQNFSDRNSQYRTFIDPHRNEFDLILKSLEDFTLRILKNKVNVTS